jgi:SAM-dependent methyltransferase
MNQTELKTIWKKEEEIAYICGWDFSHIDGRFEAAKDLPWDYRNIIRQYLKDDMHILDYDTGGGEFLLSLHHPYEKTAATEGYPPNVELCKETLLPLGVDFRACDNPADIPFQDESFDLILNRHGSYDAEEIYRLLKKDGIFITNKLLYGEVWFEG